VQTLQIACWLAHLHDGIAIVCNKLSLFSRTAAAFPSKIRSYESCAAIITA